MNKAAIPAQLHGVFVKPWFTFEADFMQGQRTKQQKAFAKQTGFSKRNPLLLACLTFFAFLFVSGFHAKAVHSVRNDQHHSFSADEAGKKISQLAEAEYSSDWENDSTDCDESEAVSEKNYSRPHLALDRFHAKTAYKGKAFSRGVPLFVLFHAWKDFLI